MKIKFDVKSKIYHEKVLTDMVFKAFPKNMKNSNLRHHVNSAFDGK